MATSDLDVVYNFYKNFNDKNSDNSLEQKELLDFKEEVVENINYDLAKLEEILQKIQKIDMTKSLNEINYSYAFRDVLTDLNSTLVDLSSEFSDFHKFNIKFIGKLPEGPKDDSELI
ncbi:MULTISPECIES: hypothetical protein [unclassified Enterococcus]|uniref:hypothetical protein n=1 Tax=unclassified Enterococcus TaxID=2608891 RepID=UPI001CE09775|nr:MULTISPECIES: hypothetical protein [unclassified Enterococcus]MCA5014044.1 hypothetical protein [Enterococcus sp. S23]MCA5017182.1 hypothetical protein [Enterococcus sp. S22(2020)]